MILEATHRTVYLYPCASRDSHNEVRLMPLDDDSQRLLQFSLDVQPRVPVFSYVTNGGTVHHFSVPFPHDRLEVVATARVETLRANPYDSIDLLSQDWDFYERTKTKMEFAEFLTDSVYVRASERVRHIAARVRQEGSTVVQYLVDLNTLVHSMLEYDPDATHVHSTVDDVLNGSGGVCQDYAHLMIACCRAQGVPARYVSGYLYGGPGMRGELATHAWLECLLPDGNWLSLDPTNNLLANDHHIRVHIGRDYADVTPTKGIYTGAPALSLEVSVTVVAAQAILV